MCPLVYPSIDEPRCGCRRAQYTQRKCEIHALRLVLRLPGFLWRQRQSVAVAVLVAPLALTGDLELFAVNFLALGYAGFVVLKAVRGK